MLRPSPGGPEAASTLPAPLRSPQAGLFRDRILLLLLNGMSVEAAEGYCLEQGMDLETAKRLVAEARQRITVAADYTREEQLGLAVCRLEDLYSKSIAAKDTRTALQAQREIEEIAGQLDEAAGFDPARAETALSVFEFSHDLADLWRGSNSAARREILECVSLNRTLSDVSLCLTMRKPFDFLAERPFLRDGRGDWI